MYIEPDSTIHVCTAIPLDASYDHTIFWSDAQSQAAYFASRAKYTFEKQTYQRVNRGYIRVEKPADQLYNCNYLAFQNTAYGNKWFYAFIKDVEYINDLVTEIHYELDVIQTWFFEFEIDPCFIEREHVTQDNPGDNLVPENLELGEYIVDGFTREATLNATSIVIAATVNDFGQDVSAGAFYGGLYTGLYYHVFPNDNNGGVGATALINQAVEANKADAIVAIFLAPTAYVTQRGSGPRTYNHVEPKRNSGQIDGYTPRNKKLFTYPYNFLYVTNLQGNAAAFPYEYFTDEQCNFALTGSFTPSPEVMLCPVNYKGNDNQIFGNLDERMILSGFPQLGWNTDSFKAWLAQNGVSLAVSAASVVGEAAAGMVFPALTGLGSLLSTSVQHVTQPNQARGSNAGSVLAATQNLNFLFANKHIRHEFAEIIDSYFDAYGYAVHRIGVPNRNTRPHWNYVKTARCHISGRNGAPPADAETKICEIHDRGITYWKNAEEVGRYDLDNSI